jgi:hypothetical protein
MTDGGNECNFNAKGEAQGFDVALSTNSVHFGEVAVDNSTNRLINVQNNNDMPCTFQFVTDKNNMFSFSQTEGVVKPFSFARIIVTFVPPKTGNFYERIFCMVRNHQVLYVDLMGTCFDILTKPIPLMQRHVDANRHKVIMGAHKKANAQNTSEEYAWDKTNTLNSGSNQVLMAEGADLEMPMDDPSQVVIHKEMIHNSTANTRDVQFNTDNVDFGFTDRGRISEGRTLSLTNKFSFPIVVNWHLLEVMDSKSGQMVKNPFRVNPACAEIPAGENRAFDAEFAPYEPDSYFF